MAVAHPAAREAPRVAFITGITGQDGTYLAELLLSKGYTVHGLIRRVSSTSASQERLARVLATHDCGSRCQLHHGDMCDPCCLARLVAHIRPDEVYNLAAQSHVGVSFEIPAYTTEVNGAGALHLLEAIRLAGLQHSCRFYQASTSEMFGKVLEPVQSERTAFNPRSPYACAKLFAHTITKNYRDAYGMYAVCGLLFNHESPRRGELFVTRKISLAVAAIAAGFEDCMVLGNLDATRDWGHARDYVVAMHAMLQQPTPEDFVVATGETRSVRAFVEAAFHAGGMGSVLWQGTGLDEVAVLQAPHTAGRVVVRLSAEFTRPSEVDALIGDPRKAVATLGFNPRATPFEQLVAEMVHADMVRLAEMRAPGLVISTPEQRATSSAPAEEDHEMPIFTI